MTGTMRCHQTSNDSLPSTQTATSLMIDETRKRFDDVHTSICCRLVIAAARTDYMAVLSQRLCYHKEWSIQDSVVILTYYSAKDITSDIPTKEHYRYSLQSIFIRGIIIKLFTVQEHTCVYMYIYTMYSTRTCHYVSIAY